MPEEGQVTQTADQGTPTASAATQASAADAGKTETKGNQQQPSLGWRAGLPDELKENAAFTPYKTVGDFAKFHLETAKKVADLEGKLDESIPKLPDDATQEERDIYLMSLGRPETAAEYELEGEDKNAPEWTGFWRNEFFKLGLTKDTVKALSGSFNSQIQKMVEAHNAALKKENDDTATKLKAEWGDKYDANVQLATRLWKTYTDGDFDKAFTGETSANRYAIMRYILKVAAKTGEDTSLPKTATALAGDKNVTFIKYDKSPEPPRKS